MRCGNTAPKIVIIIFFGMLFILLAYTYGFKTNISHKIHLKQSSHACSRAAGQTTSRLCIYNASSVEETYSESKLKYSKGTAIIYIYPPKKDIVSDYIRKNGVWENWITGQMEKWFDKDPDLQLIDIGSNIGAFTITAAMRGRRVVAVDPNINNIKMTRKTVMKNKVQNLVTLFWNGVSDTYDEFSIRSDSFNVGDSVLETKKNKNAKKSDLVKTIYMDDLLKVIPFKKALMKIDIEGHEHKALARANQLFKKINITGVFMEWRFYVNAPQKAANLIYFFTTHDYIPCVDLDIKRSLDINKFSTWPWDMTWKKKD